MITKNSKYDLVVLGSGPGGQKAAVQAAKLGKSVLIVERQKLGGACLHLGTIPSKTLREVALDTTTGQNTVAEVMDRTHVLIKEEMEIVREQLTRNKIEIVQGTGSFISANEIQIDSEGKKSSVTAEIVIIAVGSRPRRTIEIEFDDKLIFESDTILSLHHQPQTMLVIGAGVIGCEYASIFARMGVHVTLLDSKPDLLPSIDQEITAALSKQFEKAGLTLKLGYEWHNMKRQIFQNHSHVTIELKGKNGIEACAFDVVLCCLGRIGNSDTLSLQNTKIKANERGLISVNNNYQTNIKNIYAVGDVIGAPALAASSAEQGRLAVLHAFQNLTAQFSDNFPYGIYTIPEISSVGVQEFQLQKKKVKYVVGIAPYRELARGKMINDEYGFLKLIVHAKTRRIIGVHVIGTGATELVHIGQVAMNFSATVDFFVDNIFNYPTLAEAYKVAALQALNRLK